VCSDNASLFTTDIARLDELRLALEGYSDRDKLDAMKRLIGMMSQGSDVSIAFPSVVKNVVSSNSELKKLVHMYLVHYADVEPDTILLSINTFQKDMRGPNQLIRASALRVMSSIRAAVIAQPVVLAIRAAVIDSSAYVRKAACAALLKVYSVDADLRDELIDILVDLLKDNSTQVLGSAIQVFQEVKRCRALKPKIFCRSLVRSLGSGLANHICRDSLVFI
jgi:AP-3 complex subunit beta